MTMKYESIVWTNKIAAVISCCSQIPLSGHTVELHKSKQLWNRHSERGQTSQTVTPSVPLHLATMGDHLNIIRTNQKYSSIIYTLTSERWQPLYKGQNAGSQSSTIWRFHWNGHCASNWVPYILHPTYKVPWWSQQDSRNSVHHHNRYPNGSIRSLLPLPWMRI